MILQFSFPHEDCSRKYPQKRRERYDTKLNDTKNSDIAGNELDECGLLSLFGARW